ncbi:hypothetical protein [Thiohalocapsa halophila]|jgi:hypothetical protein
MIQITVDIPEGSLASLHKDPESFAREMRIAAAVQCAEDLSRKALAAGWGNPASRVRHRGPP